MELNQILSLSPDEKGIIEVELEGVKRKFVKEKLIRFLDGPPSILQNLGEEKS